MNIILSGEKQSFSPKVRNMAGMSTIITAVQHSSRSPSLSNQATERKKRHLNWQRNPKIARTHRGIQQTAGYKINAQKSVAFLYTNNETEEKEIKESIPFTPAPKTVRHPGINLAKEAKDLYSENYRILVKEIEEDTKKWKNIPCSWIGRTNIVKISMLPKAIYTFDAITIKMSLTFLTVLKQTILKFLRNKKRP